MALEVVGPSMALVSQVEKGICADLMMACQDNHNAQKHRLTRLCFKNSLYRSCSPLRKHNVFMPKVMAHPHSKHQQNIAQAVE